MGSAGQSQGPAYGGMNQQYSGPNWWVPSGGGGQPQGGQPLWQNPYSPLTPADWEALRMQYYPAASPAAGSAESIYQAYLRGGESQAADEVESYYGPSPNPAIFGPIAAKVQQWTGLPPEFFTVTHAAPGAYDSPDYQLGSTYGAVSGVEAADVSQATHVTVGPALNTFGEAGTIMAPTRTPSLGWAAYAGGGEGAGAHGQDLGSATPGGYVSGVEAADIGYGYGYGDFGESEADVGGFGFGVGGMGFGDNEGYGGGEGGAQGW